MFHSATGTVPHISFFLLLETKFHAQLKNDAVNLLHPLSPALLLLAYHENPPPTRERGPPNTLPKSTQPPTSLTIFLTQLSQTPLLFTFPSSSSSPKTSTLTAQFPTFFTYTAPSLFFVFLARSRTKNGKHHLVIIIFTSNNIVNLTILGRHF